MRFPRLLPAICVLSLSALSALSAPVFAGDLAPPVGPITPTHKTLTQVEPRIPINATNTPGDADSLFRIAQPGSYYLTGNLTGVAAKHGIKIASRGVTIDLMGFEMLGVTGSLDGISAVGLDVFNVTVRNGTLRAWGGDGVDLTSTSNLNDAVVDVISSDNGADGIIVTFNSSITNCTSFGNVGVGLRCQAAGVITSCLTYGNGGSGINAAGNCVITGCSAFDNGGDGIEASDGSTIIGCAASDNALNGIQQNTTGIITNCTANSNNAAGIRTNDGCTITNCAVRFNNLDGIYVTDACIVKDSTCTFSGSGANDGAGIYAHGDDNRIEGNVCISADRGIHANGVGNFIARNTCSNNTTNWQIAIGNLCLVVNATPTTVVISGDSGGLSPGSTNPNANFTN